MKFKTFDELNARANKTVYGLAASILSNNMERTLQVAHALRTGTVWLVDISDNIEMEVYI